MADLSTYRLTTPPFNADTLSKGKFTQQGQVLEGVVYTGSVTRGQDVSGNKATAKSIDSTTQKVTLANNKYTDGSITATTSAGDTPNFAFSISGSGDHTTYSITVTPPTFSNIISSFSNPVACIMEQGTATPYFMKPTDAGSGAGSKVSLPTSATLSPRSHTWAQKANNTYTNPYIQMSVTMKVGGVDYDTKTWKIESGSLSGSAQSFSLGDNSGAVDSTANTYTFDLSGSPVSAGGKVTAEVKSHATVNDPVARTVTFSTSLTESKDNSNRVNYSNKPTMSTTGTTTFTQPAGTLGHPKYTWAYTCTYGCTIAYSGTYNVKGELTVVTGPEAWKSGINESTTSMSITNTNLTFGVSGVNMLSKPASCGPYYFYPLCNISGCVTTSSGAFNINIPNSTTGNNNYLKYEWSYSESGSGNWNHSAGTTTGSTFTLTLPASGYYTTEITGWTDTAQTVTANHSASTLDVTGSATPTVTQTAHGNSGTKNYTVTCKVTDERGVSKTASTTGSSTINLLYLKKYNFHGWDSESADWFTVEDTATNTSKVTFGNWTFQQCAEGRSGTFRHYYKVVYENNKSDDWKTQTFTVSQSKGTISAHIS